VINADANPTAPITGERLPTAKTEAAETLEGGRDAPPTIELAVAVVVDATTALVDSATDVPPPSDIAAVATAVVDSALTAEAANTAVWSNDAIPATHNTPTIPDPIADRRIVPNLECMNVGSSAALHIGQKRLMGC
jgi:hypothetical protein